MKILLLVSAAVVSYLVGSINPAIILSKALYKIDVRQHGSHNAGFTNFRRVLGSEDAWAVLLWDMAKSAVVCALFGWLFKMFFGLYHTGAAGAMLFAMIGHAYPVWYEFQGGKCAAVFAGGIWFIDWRAGLIALALFAALLAAARFMSLAVMIATASCPVTIAFLGAEHPAVLILMAAAVALIWFRHRENIGRLIHGTESKFSFHDL